MYEEDILYVVKKGAQNELIALLAQNGSVLYKIPFTYSLFSSPIYSNGMLFINQGSEIVCYFADSGKEKWRYDYGVNATLYPVIYNDALVLVTTDNVLLICNTSPPAPCLKP